MFHSSYQDFRQLAAEYDVVENDARQALLTKRLLLPRLNQILLDVSRIRDAFDKMFLQKFKNAATSTPYGILSPEEYPIGYCGIIRDALFDIFCKSPVLNQLRRQGVLLKKVYIILEGRYFQNAIQLGDLYLDVANDTVDAQKDKIVCKSFKEIEYKCFEDYESCFDVAEPYLNIKLYPNLLFPLITPIFPLFAITEDGEITLFDVHMVIAYKNIVRNYQPIKEFLLTSKYMQRTLPEEYVQLIKKEYAQAPEEFYVEFEETGTRDSLLRFMVDQLQNQGLAQERVDQILYSLAMQTRLKFKKTLIKPDQETLISLRKKGAIPTSKQANRS